MRNPKEIQKLEEVKLASKENPQKPESNWTNPKGEYFLFEDGQLMEYTDTRVINHENDRLKNLAETPFQD